MTTLGSLIQLFWLSPSRCELNFHPSQTLSNWPGKNKKSQGSQILSCDWQSWLPTSGNLFLTAKVSRYPGQSLLKQTGHYRREGQTHRRGEWPIRSRWTWTRSTFTICSTEHREFCCLILITVNPELLNIKKGILNYLAVSLKIMDCPQ